ncbi:MAG TPA: indole-3-glycerol phosphate synthase TrpC [Vicinamibacterales bacterium]|nr:indole-3-glycerol phosphate synthase TrpC [Vicinamibacterales bacterium]
MTTSAMPDLLATIVATARRITEVRRTRASDQHLERLAATRHPQGDTFVRALREDPPPRVIAECKRRSPSRGILREDYKPAEHAAAYARAGAAAISVLTEPTFFDGSLDHLRQARAVVDTPLLRKDFIVDRYQILEAVASGADAVLLIVGALQAAALQSLLVSVRELGVAALVEVHDAGELRIAADAGAELIGVNSRNLRTLSVEPHLHEELASMMPAGIVNVAESGLRQPADLRRLEKAGYHAFLVGERLITQPDPGAALAALRDGTRRAGKE